MPGVPVWGLRLLVVLALAMGTMPFVGAFGLRAADLKLEARGKVVLQRNARAAIPSRPLARARSRSRRPMREIYSRYPVRELHAELLEGKVTKKEMPQVDFSPEEVDAILAYLYSLVAKR